MSEAADPGGRCPRVHAITDDAVLTRPGFLPRARVVMAALGELGAVHVRARTVPARPLLGLVRELCRLRENSGCRVCVNDRADVMLAAGADGVQLARGSLAVRDARRLVGEALIGVSVHEMEEARTAGAGGADWVIFGHVHPTPSHPGARGRGLAALQAVSRAAATPVIAIGGIRPEHVAALRATGAAGVAVIRGIWYAHDAGQAAVEYLSAMAATTTREERSIRVNGDPRTVRAGSSVGDLLRQLSLDPRTVVVELNRTILRDRSVLDGVELGDGDIVEIVHFVGGG